MKSSLCRFCCWLRSETGVLEDLATTYQKLRDRFLTKLKGSALGYFTANCFVFYFTCLIDRNVRSVAVADAAFFAVQVD